eukprot:jgi/Mesvir1/21516/Mv03959-RA.1
MTFFHTVNCAALAFAPHFVFYHASYLAEYGAKWSCLKAGLIFACTALMKLVLQATFLQVSDGAHFDLGQELTKTLIGLMDVGGVYYALTQVTHRLSGTWETRFLAVGLGWSLANSLLQRALVLLLASRSTEFTWDYVVYALESNVDLLITMSFACVMALLSRKKRPAALMPALYAGVLGYAIMPALSRCMLFLVWETALVWAPCLDQRHGRRWFVNPFLIPVICGWDSTWPQPQESAPSLRWPSAWHSSLGEHMPTIASRFPKKLLE